MTFVFILIYLSLQLLIAFFISKTIKTEKDFFLAGRNLPLWLLSFSLFATWFGAETCIGTSGAVFKEGLSGSRADPFGYSLCLFFLGFFLAKKLWLGGYTTLADFYRDRFDGKIETIAIMILVPSALLWGAAQMRAFSQVISTMTDWDLSITLWMAFAFVTVYTLLGGLLGDMITDFLQGIMIALGLCFILFAILKSDFDFFQWWENLPAERLSFKGSNETLWQRMDRWAIPIFGSLVAQELISRTLSARSASVAQSSAYVSCFIYLIFGSIPVLLGLMGTDLIGGLNHHEDFIITLAEKYLTPLGFVVFSGALISAILATIDSIFLSASALVSHNILVPLLKIKDEKKKVLSARCVVVASALFSIGVAFISDSIYQLVEIASSFGTAGVLVVTLFGLHTAWGGRFAALMALFFGIITTPLAEYVFEWQAPFITTLLVSVVAYLLGAYWSRSSLARLKVPA